MSSSPAGKGAFVQVEELALNQSLQTHGRGKLGNRLVARFARKPLDRGHDAEGVTEQRHGGENGDMLAELAVDRRPAASQHGVVHAGDVVEHQRGGMNHLHRAGQVEQARVMRVATQVASGEHQQQRPGALSRRQRALAHRGADEIALTAGGQELFETPLQRLLEQRQLLVRGWGRFCGVSGHGHFPAVAMLRCASIRSGIGPDIPVPTVRQCYERSHEHDVSVNVYKSYITLPESASPPPKRSLLRVR